MFIIFILLFFKKKKLIFLFSPSAKLKSQTVYMDTTTEPYSTALQITLHLLDSAAAHIALFDAHTHMCVCVWTRFLHVRVFKEKLCTRCQGSKMNPSCPIYSSGFLLISKCSSLANIFILAAAGLFFEIKIW